MIVCLYMCVYVCVYMYVCIFMCVYVCVYMYVCILCVYIYVCVYMYVCISICVYVYVYMCVYMLAWGHVCGTRGIGFASQRRAVCWVYFMLATICCVFHTIKKNCDRGNNISVTKLLTRVYITLHTKIRFFFFFFWLELCDD